MTWLRNGEPIAESTHDGTRAAEHYGRITDQAVNEIWHTVRRVENFTEPQYRGRLSKALVEAAEYLSNGKEAEAN